MKFLTSVFIVIAVVFSGMMVKTNITPRDLGVHNGRLKDVPFTPNAVSSQTDDTSKFVNPLPFNSSEEESYLKLTRILKELKGVEIMKQEAHYIYAVATSSTLKYKDDLEFYFDTKSESIHVRSASRVGFSDGGVNRKRYERIQKRYLDSN